MRAGTVALAALGIALLLPQAASAAPTPVKDNGVNLNIPWAIGGLRIERDGTKRVHPGEWPTVPVASVRIWDARTAWLNIEPANDQWDFTRLDAFVEKAEAKGVKNILMTLGGTPMWAAKQQKATDAPWLGKGSASPPKRWADWAEFVQKVAQRYQGRIHGYEIWNEPNSLTYWSGSNEEWSELTGIASREIAKADPEAQIVIGAFATSPTKTLNKIAPMLDALKPQEATATPTAISIHWYPTRKNLPAGVSAIATQVRQAAEKAGIKNLPLWITEMNLRDGASLSAKNQQAAMQSMTDSASAGGIQRSWWYAWTDLGPNNLIQIYEGTPAARWLRSIA
ncbi:MAG: cellulase family glycosylhydrolase [Actinomycetota bacterium]|nr:cellulase family glycosylhydrolase [Actinomycetota bacterium]